TFNTQIPVSLPLNSWSHIASTYDGSTLKLYVNGVLAGSIGGLPSLGAITTSTRSLLIGADSLGNNFQGLIHDVRICNRAPTAGEMESDRSTPLGASLDSTAPTVAVTSPANNAAVSGQTTLTVNTADNVQVAGVQYLLNGTPLGAEVRTAPYSCAWNTSTV